VLAQFWKGIQFEQALAGGGGVDGFVLEDPGVRMMDVYGVQAGGKRGVDVGARAVADHPGSLA